MDIRMTRMGRPSMLCTKGRKKGREIDVDFGF
jgi:hypothetical protein